MLKEVRLVLCSSLLFACRGFGRLKRGIAMYRSGTAHPAKHVLSSRTACAVPGNMRLPSCSGMQDTTHLWSTQHTGLLAWERHSLCVSATQNTEEGFKAGPGKQFALLTDGRPNYRTAEIVCKCGWSQVEKIRGLILPLLGKHSDPVGYTRGKRWRLLIFLLCLGGK